MDYSEKLTQSIRSVKPSGIRRFFDIVNEMDNVISLSVGEPDFQTPWHVREAGITSLEQGKTWYTPNRGFKELCREISNFYKRKYNLTYDPLEECVVTVGGSEAVDIAIRCLASAGDEVLIPQPSFVCYEPLTMMAGATPVIIETKAENAFRLTAEQLEEKITEKTKLLILPYPNNPTGGIMKRRELEELAKVVREKQILVISDEIYAELTYGGLQHESFASIPGMWDYTVTINGFSKAFAMTGWRIGYACGPAEIMDMVNKIHQYAILCAPRMSQMAAVEALRTGREKNYEDIRKMRDSYDRRRRLLVGAFREMGLECFEPLGAFYIFPSIQKTGMTSEAFCSALLQEKHIATVPGTAFGASGEGHIRCSYATGIDKLNLAVKGIKAFLESR